MEGGDLEAGRPRQRLPHSEREVERALRAEVGVAERLGHVLRLRRRAEVPAAADTVVPGRTS